MRSAPPHLRARSPTPADTIRLPWIQFDSQSGGAAAGKIGFAGGPPGQFERGSYPSDERHAQRFTSVPITRLPGEVASSAENLPHSAPELGAVRVYLNISATLARKRLRQEMSIICKLPSLSQKPERQSKSESRFARTTSLHFKKAPVAGPAPEFLLQSIALWEV